MTKLHFVLLFTLCSYINLSAQDMMTQNMKGRALYRITFQTDSTNINTTRNEIAELLYNDDAYLFRTVNFGRRDSALHAQEKSNTYDEISIPFMIETDTRLSFQILKTKDTLHTFAFIFTGGRNIVYRYTEPEASIEWTLSDDTKEISGFACQRATCQIGGRHWEAWFTTEIPLNLGPYKFSGLPGLVLSITDNSGTWNMEFVEINAQYQKRIELHRYPRRPIVTTSKEEYFNKKKYAQQNVGQLYLADPIHGRGLSEPELKARVKGLEESAKSDNNWIELGI